MPKPKKTGNGSRGGRPLGSRNRANAEWRDIWDEFDGPNRAKTLALLARLHSEGVSPGGDWRAAADLLDRRYGKAKQAVEVSGEGGNPIAITILPDDGAL